ncbi:MAG: serine hydroxymethyltransferase, partial [Moritella sp.]|nr:serine hydroxymethyltransferase [Moritella sp.]
PNDPRSPFVTSGLRIGTPALARRGIPADKAAALAGWMCDVLDNIGNEEVAATVRANVQALCADYPVYK